jgi:hypothetical protein
MRLPRLVDLSDPTFLALSLSLGFICRSPTPWGYTCVRPDFRVGWVYLWSAQALAVVVLHPRSRLAWISVAVAALFVVPFREFSVESLRYTLFGWLLDQFPFSMRLRQPLWWGILLAGYALSVRAAFPGAGWLRPLAAAVIATTVSLGARIAPEFLHLRAQIYAQSPSFAQVALILTYLSPAIVLPAVLWRSVRWSDTLLFLLFAAATPLLSWMTVCKFHMPQNPVTIGLALAIAFSGGLIAWCRLAWQPGSARGFDVIVPNGITPFSSR